MTNNPNEMQDLSITVHFENLLSSEVDREPVAFNWPHIDKGCRRIDYIYLGGTKRDVYALALYQEPLPESLSEKVRSKMKQETHNDMSFYYVETGKQPETLEITDICEHLSETTNTTTKMKRVTRDRRVRSEEIETKELTLKELKEMLKQNSVMFYTGAGISVAAGLPSAEALKQGLGVEMGKKTDSFTETLAVQGSQLHQKLQELQCLFYGSATPAHRDLEKIRVSNPDRIVLATENLDKLHQQAGSPIIAFGKISEVSNDALRQLDYIITVGLQQACTDLLERYKKINPSGKIIAINIKPPPYQYEADYYVKGDSQDTLADIVE